MRKVGWIFLAIVVVLTVLIGTVIFFWPIVGPWLPHQNLVAAWLTWLVVDLQINRWAPAVLLLLVGVVELILAMALSRRSGLPERQLKRADRQHTLELDLLRQKVQLLEDESRILKAELDLRDDLIREERIRLWSRFDDLQRGSDTSVERLVVLGGPDPSTEIRSEWRQIIGLLERIDLVEARNPGAGSQHLHSDRAGDLQRLGAACYYLGQYERALTHWNKAHALSPEDPVPLIDLGAANHCLGRHAQALEHLDRALSLKADPWASFYRGLVREQQGDELQAVDDYGQAVHLDPDFVEGYFRRGLLYARLGEASKACQDLDRVIELDKIRHQAYTARGVSRVTMGEYKWALADLEIACNLAPDDHEAFYQRGVLRCELEMHELALRDFGRATELAPANEAILMARGDCLTAMGEYNGAVADYGLALELEPNNALAYYARGKALAAASEYQRAIEDFDLALEQDALMAVALAQRGASKVKLGHNQAAVSDLDQAIALDPSLALAFYNRGLVYGSQGEYDRASRDINRAVELDPSFANGRDGLPPGTH